MVILLTAAALLIIGAEVTWAVWPARSEHSPGPLERLTMTATIAASCWLASTWILALLRQLTAGVLWGRALLLCAIALVFVIRRVRKFERREWTHDRRKMLLLAIVFLPVLVWVDVILWRGAIVPPLSHDALSYHLPKAVLFARSDGFRYLAELEARQRNIPANYELLLTEMIVTQRSDAYTEWPSMAFYVLLVIASGALAERWWNRGLVSALVMIFMAGIPVMLLHSGAHKNDLLVAFCMVAAMVFAGRWLRRGDLVALLLSIAAIAMGLGTKPQVAGLALFLAPFVIVRLFRDCSLKRIAAVIGYGVIAFLLLGGVVYVVNMREERSVVGTSSDAQDVISYGDWSNLWQGPYVLLAAPFSPAAHELNVPWNERPWFWRRYEIFFSHLGIPFALCALLAPFAAWRLRRAEGRGERWAITIAALAAFALMLPVVFKPHGMFAISLPRYALFLAPIVFAWALALVQRRLATVLLIAGAASFVVYAADNAANDAFVPLDYVMWARNNRGTRTIPFDTGRAASFADRVAGPNDKIALDVSYASWIHPAFGAHLTRPVFFIPPAGPPVIPDDAKWVVVDRSFSIIWEAPGMNDLSDAQSLILRGTPRLEELRVRRALLRDPRFKLVYVRLGTNQVVFQRVRG